MYVNFVFDVLICHKNEQNKTKQKIENTMRFSLFVLTFLSTFPIINKLDCLSLTYYFTINKSNKENFSLFPFHSMFTSFHEHLMFQCHKRNLRQTVL